MGCCRSVQRQVSSCWAEEGGLPCDAEGLVVQWMVHGEVGGERHVEWPVEGVECA